MLLRIDLDLDRRRPRDALGVARVAVAEHHPEMERGVKWSEGAKYRVTLGLK